MQYLAINLTIAELVYGGRVTDQNDMILLKTMLKFVLEGDWLKVLLYILELQRVVSFLQHD